MKPRFLALLPWGLLFCTLCWCHLAASFLYDALAGKLVWLNWPCAVIHALGAAWLLHRARTAFRFNRASKAAAAAIAAMKRAADRYSDSAFDAASDQANAAIAEMRKHAKLF